MESELKKAVNLYEKGQLNSAKEIALNIYNSKRHILVLSSRKIQLKILKEMLDDRINILYEKLLENILNCLIF